MTARLTGALRATSKALVAVLMVINALLLVPSAYVSVVLGDYLPTLIAVVMSALFWLACYAVLCVVRTRRRARHSVEPAGAELTPTRPLPVQPRQHP
jgi:ABC-type protease/lipase transport system fused ATPase/permease subunit